MKIIAVYSPKGGVGKSTFAVNLAWAAAQLSARRTLLWDLDAQGAATWLMNVPGTATDEARAIFSRDVDAAQQCRKTAFDNLDLLAADTSLQGLERLFSELGKKRRLAKTIGQLARRYDRIILDCPPGINETANQVLRACDILVVPVVPSPLARKSLKDLADHLVKRGGKHPPILPVFSMVDRRRRIHADALSAEADWPVIPYASIVEQMGKHRAPLGAFAPASPAARQFVALWAGVEKRISTGRS